MHSSRTLLGSLVLIASASLATTQDAVPRHSTPTPGSAFLHPERIPLRGGGYVTADRGMLFVPIVRSDPESATIGIEFYRFRAQDGVPPVRPPIFRLNGGPGWPGLEGLLERLGGYEEDILPFTEFADVVYVGQRGIGSSRPDTICAGPPEDAKRTPEEEDEALRRACLECRRFWEAQGYDLSGFNVIEAAADVDAIRQLLGYEQITIWGGSFGSHWGMAVMRYHPEGVARAVLTGMEGPDHTYDMPSGVLAALERMASEAEAAPALAEHIPEDGLIQALRDVIVDVEEEPIEIELGGELVRIAADDLRDFALGYTNRAGSRNGIPTWPADVIALYRGDFERVARALRQRRNGGSDGLPTASFFMLDCGSGISTEREARLNSDPAAAVVGNLGRFYQLTCPAWGADLGDEFRAGFVTDISTVIVHGVWDVSTPFENALELLPSFNDVHFVVVEGGTHGALGEALRHSQEFRAALMEFIATGDRSDLPTEVRLPPIAWAPPHTVN